MLGNLVSNEGFLLILSHVEGEEVLLEFLLDTHPQRFSAGDQHKGPGQGGHHLNERLN